MKYSEQKMVRWLWPAILIGMLLLASQVIVAGPGDSPKMSGALSDLAAGNGSAMVDVIVMFHNPPGPTERNMVAGQGAAVKREFTVIPGMAVRMSANALSSMADDPAVSYVTLDAPMFAAADTSYNAVRELTGLPISGDFAYDGAGIGVAVVDSGFTRNFDLDRDNVLRLVLFSDAEYYDG